MKTIREFLEEQINEQLIQAVVSGRRTGEGPSKVKLRPVELKGKLCYQASVTEGTKVYHKNYSREEIIDYLEQAMEEFRQLQVIGRSQDGSILISKKGKATIKTKNHKAVQNESVKIAPHNRVKQYILKEGTAAPFLVDLGVMTKDGKIVASRYDQPFSGIYSGYSSQTSERPGDYNPGFWLWKILSYICDVLLSQRA